MATLPAPTLFDEVLDFLASTPTPEDIIAFRPSEMLQERASYLLDKKRTDSLTGEEEADLDAFTWMNHFISMLKIRARRRDKNS